MRMLDHFNANNEVVAPDVLERIALLAQEIVFMQKALKGN